MLTKKLKKELVKLALYIIKLDERIMEASEVVKMKPTKTELQILISIHLRGYMGKMGSMSSKERLKLLKGLVKKGWLTENATLTKEGIEVSKPSANKI